MSVTAIILAGGRASRMGGVDKGLMPLNNKPLISYVLACLKPQVSGMIINANREFETYKALGYPVFADEIADFAGPLAGIQLGLMQATSEYLLTAPCDCPLLPSNLCKKLLIALETEHADIAIATNNHNDHPVISLCKTALLDNLNNYLQQGGRKVSTWQKSLNHVYVDFSETPDAFTNINTIEDLNHLTLKLNHV
jgi:molybdopterin-guanine dinucleotide biosynthesis protein A